MNNQAGISKHEPDLQPDGARWRDKIRECGGSRPVAENQPWETASVVEVLTENV